MFFLYKVGKKTNNHAIKCDTHTAVLHYGHYKQGKEPGQYALLVNQGHGSCQIY